MRAVLLPIHITGGGLAIVLGALALLVVKGGSLHRKSGILFVYAMVTMGVSASILAYVKGGVAEPNFLGGLMAAYFAVTAMTTAQAASAMSRRINIVAAIVAFSTATFYLTAAVRTFAAGHLFLKGVPAPMILFLGTIIALAAVGDVRVIRRGPLHGAARLKRHLWRMCFALFIAAGSFFSIRSRVAKVLPEPFLSAPPRILLILLPFVPMFYWLWRLGHSNHISRNKPIPS